MKALRACIFAIAIVFAIAAFTLALTPKPALYGDISFSSGVEDRDHRLLRLATASDQRYRLKHSLDELTQSAIDATLLYEDRHFYAHPGVNPGALLRAAWSTFVIRNRVVGASTITMQLARLRFDLNTTTIPGKLLQIARALQLEHHYAKNDILEAYLNLAPYGGNVEGIGTASLVYFDKPAALLNLPEALTLAVIPQNPAKRNPTTASGYAEMVLAKRRLQAAWEEQFGLSQEQQAQLALPLAVRSTAQLPYKAPHFSRDLLAGLGQQTAANHGLTTATLDWVLQKKLQRLIRSYNDRHRSMGLRNASALLIDHRSMEILAAVGSSDFFNEHISGQVNGTRSKRSPGSTLKPFVYGLALDRGIIHPMSLLKDAPRRFAAYTPENFDRGFMGPIMATDALIYSRNVPAIELLSNVSHNSFHEFLLAAGVTGLKSADHYGLAAILGGNELTMEELVRLYAMLANGGVLRPLRAIRDNTKVPPASSDLLSAEASFLVLDMLRKNPRLDKLTIASTTKQVPIAWKTGTSYAFRDAWTIGVFGPYVLAVWIGNFDGSSNPAFVGRKAAAPLFFEIADSLTAGLPQEHLSSAPPSHLNLRKVDICAGTGDLPGRHCPRTKLSWFIPGVSPIKVSSIHRAVRIDNATGKRSCSFNTKTTHQALFEFWPSDISLLFRQAGIAIRQPPPWSTNCSLELQAATGSAPRITSPAAHLSYHVRSGTTVPQGLPLTATTDADVQWLYWFANDRFVARVERNKPVYWAPGVGAHDLLAVDDLGRSHSRLLNVSLAQ